MAFEQLATRLVQFESTQERPDEIRACLDFCVSFFDRLPIYVERHECEGVPSVVISTHPGREFDVLLLGHIDTVSGAPSLFEGRVENGKLFGRGTMDMKAFVATSMVVFHSLVEEGTDKRLALMIVSDEELGGRFGARYLVEEMGYRAATVLVPDDGEQIQTIVTETKHIFHVDFFAEGKEAHGGWPWQGRNAIEMLLETYQNLNAHFSLCKTFPKDDWINTINLGTISGGTAANEVPGHATMRVDIRVTSQTTREEVMGWIQDACVPGVRSNLCLEGHPTIVSKDDPVLRLYGSIIERVTGLPPLFSRSGGGTDGRYFSAKGMRVIVHQGNGGNCQSDEEYVDLASAQQLIEIQKEFVRDIEKSA